VRMKRGGWMEMTAGLAITVLGHAVLVRAVPGSIWRFAGPLGTWLFMFGFIAVGLRWLDRPVGSLRYLYDAS